MVPIPRNFQCSNARGQIRRQLPTGESALTERNREFQEYTEIDLGSVGTRMKKVYGVFMEDLSELRLEAWVGLKSRQREQQQPKDWRREKASSSESCEVLCLAGESKRGLLLIMPVETNKSNNTFWHGPLEVIEFRDNISWFSPKTLRTEKGRYCFLNLHEDTKFDFRDWLMVMYPLLEVKTELPFFLYSAFRDLCARAKTEQPGRDCCHPALFRGKGCLAKY